VTETGVVDDVIQLDDGVRDPGVGGRDEMVHSGKRIEGGRRSIEEEVKLLSCLSRPLGLGNEVHGIVGPGDEAAVDGEGRLSPRAPAPLVGFLWPGTNSSRRASTSR
jgi:hypothetical protein